MNLTVTHPFAATKPSAHVSLVADHFGVGPEHGTHVVAEDLHLDIAPESVVLFTGPSGSGKSSLLRAAVAELKNDDATVLELDALPLPDAALIDGLALPFDDALVLLTSCGLAEPVILLRRPAELSDGQRFRYRVATAVAALRREPDDTPRFLAVDEFTATLDRTLAKVVAHNLGRFARRDRFGLLAATTHEDVAEDLAPDVRVLCDLDGAPVVLPAGVKKNAPCRFSENSTSRPARDATGRISLGGITAATASV